MQKRDVAVKIPEKAVSVGKGSVKTAVSLPSSLVVPKGRLGDMVIGGFLGCSFSPFTVFGKSEIVRLYDAARKYLDNRAGINRWSPFERLVRCKPSDYFDRLKESMIPYLKDQNGHAASAINGRIRGEWVGVVNACALCASKLLRSYFRPLLRDQHESSALLSLRRGEVRDRCPRAPQSRHSQGLLRRFLLQQHHDDNG